MFEFENYAWISRKCVRKRENTAQKLKAVVRKELKSSQHKFSFITNLAQASSLYDNDGGADPRHVFLAIRSKIFGVLVFFNKNVFAPKKIICNNKNRGNARVFRFHARKTTKNIYAPKTYGKTKSSKRMSFLIFSRQKS